MGFLVWIILIIVFLAMVGLGWNTFFSGIKKGADKIGITTIVENVTDNAMDIVRNTSQGIIGNSE
jgi:hypothetical protein